MPARAATTDLRKELISGTMKLATVQANGDGLVIDLCVQKHTHNLGSASSHWQKMETKRDCQNDPDHAMQCAASASS